MAYVVNKLIRYLTKRHDARNARRHTYEPGLHGAVDLTPCEQIPSVMLAFHLVETVSDERKLVRLMRRVFEKNPNVRNQYGQAGETLLYAACKRGVLELVHFLVESGENCQIVTPLGSPYHGVLRGLVAGDVSMSVFEQIVHYLFTQGCDVNAADHHLMSPFLCAVDHGHLPAIACFVHLGCDVNLRGRLANHALHLACIKSRPDVVTCLLEIPFLHRTPLSEQGWSPLYMAVTEWTHMFYKRTNAESSHQEVRVKGHLQLMIMVEALLLAGADPFALSSKKSYNLLKTLIQVRKEETNKGRWCSMCSQPISKENTGSHDCGHVYIGCPCKLTPLLSVQSSEECVNELVDNSTSVRGTPYGTNAVPYTSQVLASVLLYASHHHQYHHGEPSQYIPHLTQCMTVSADMCDPYIDNLLRYFSERGRGEHNTPLPLKALSRSVIRLRVGENWGRVGELPIPRQIMEYVAMKVLL